MCGDGPDWQCSVKCELFPWPGPPSSHHTYSCDAGSDECIGGQGILYRQPRYEAVLSCLSQCMPAYAGTHWQVTIVLPSDVRPCE